MSESLQSAADARVYAVRTCLKNNAADQRWRYKGEVGYNMRTNPPTPLMSAEDPRRPSAFPLGAAIRDGVLNLRKSEIEASQKGLLRIPDVVIVKDIGNPLPVQANIERVVEIKFPGDKLSQDQKEAYELIAGGIAKFYLLKYEECECSDKKKPEPHYVPIPIVVPKEELARERAPLVAPQPLPCGDRGRSTTAGTRAVERS